MLLKYSYQLLLNDVHIAYNCFMKSISLVECCKSVHIRSFFFFFFSRIRTEYEDLLRKSPNSVQTLENTDQKKLRF